MRNLELVDYLIDIRGKYEFLGGSDGEAPDKFITSEHNKITGSSLSKTGQNEYYRNHKKYGKDFVKIVNEINGFVAKYPNLIHELFTTNETSSGFGYVLATSDDEKEAFEWKERFSGVEGDVQIPVASKVLHATNSVHIITNPNWRKLEDPERRIDDGYGTFDDDGKFYGFDNQSSMDVLNAYLSKKRLIFASHPDLGLEERFQFDSGEYYVEDDYYKYRVGSFIKYPVLHPRVKTYLGLLKKFFGTVLKIEEIKYNAIDIIPINSVDIAIYVATNAAEDINSHYNVISSIKDNVNFMSGNIMSRIASAYNILEFQNDYNEAGEYVSEIDEDKMSNDSLYFSFYKRDRELRFQSLMSARLDRINESIQSLNKLHNPTNYKFEKKDFDSAHKSIQDSLKEFELKYKSYFESKDSTLKKISNVKEILKEFESEEEFYEVINKYKKENKEKKSE
tara:strand:- start:8201 stop:9553 length:1353 start_codon:yes stop_codon:yes gene_type:complete